MATRRERVILDLEDRFSPGMTKAAAQTALLNRELGSLSRDSVRTRRAVSDIDQPIEKVGRSSNSSSREVDKLSGRLGILADVAAILGPSLVPIAAVGVPAVSGLAAQLGFAAIAGGTMVLAFQGVGDAVKAVNAAALEPTEANLQKVEIALEKLTPAARGFVAEIGHVIPGLRELRDLAAEGFFPGATEGLKSLETALPHVQGLISAVSQELGDIAADAGASLASDRWTDFLDFLAVNAPQALGEMAEATGNTAHAVAELWMATDPLNDDFSSWLVDATGRLDDFATGLSQTQGYAEFITYVEENGPQVADTFGAIANAALQIVEAVAPLGGPVLKGVESLANLVADVADSDLGTPIFAGVAALALLNRTIAITNGLQAKTFGGPAVAQIRGYGANVRSLSADWQSYTSVQNSAAGRARASVGQLNAQAAAGKRLGTNLKSVGKGAAAVAGLGLAATGAADGLGLSNTASLALMGTIGGPWGAAIGGGVGLTLDLAHANDDLEDAIKRVNVAARTGDFSAMREGIKQLKGEIDDLNDTSGVGDFFSDLSKKAGSAITHPGSFRGSQASEAEARNAITNAEKTAAAIESANRAKARSQLIHDGYGATARNLDAATQSAQEFATALTRVNERLTKRSAAREYEAALDDFTKSLKENGKTLDKHSEKGRNNQEALDRIAASTAALATEIKNPALRAEFLDKARRQFINAQVAAGKTRGEARDLANQLIGLDKLDPKINVNADTAAADAELKRLKALMDSFHDIQVHVSVLTHSTQAGSNAAQQADNHGADGMTVPGQRWPYGDKTLILAAPGEELITNRHGEADQFRADRAAGRIPAYADGGRVGRVPGPMAMGAGVDYNKLAAAFAGDRLLGHRDAREALLWAMRTALSETPVLRASSDLSMLAQVS